MTTNNKLPSTILILSFLLFATFTTACGTCAPPKSTEPKPSPAPKPTKPKPSPAPNPTEPKPSPAPKPTKPKPSPAPKAPPANPFCPRDTLKLASCADILGLVNVIIGAPPSSEKCCAVLEGLADLEVAACLCTAIKANVLGINLNVPIALSVLVSACDKTIPPGFKCV